MSEKPLPSRSLVAEPAGPDQGAMPTGCEGNRARFAVGDAVEWESQAGGVRRLKIGTVVEVVPPNRDPQHKKGDAGFPRGEVSFVVWARPQRPGGRPQSYWPRASLLRPAAAHTMNAEKEGT